MAFLLMFIFREFIFFVNTILTNIAGLQSFFALKIAQNISHFAMH